MPRARMHRKYQGVVAYKSRGIGMGISACQCTNDTIRNEITDVGIVARKLAND